MKTLFERQKEACDFFLSRQLEDINTIDSSAVGTGKTVVAAHLTRNLGGEVAVICPKAVIPSWERELKETGIEPLFVLNYESIRRGRAPFMSKRGKKIMQWHLPKGTLILIDEIHKCKGAFTQNAQLLISLVQQGYRIHGMSATAAEDPTEMRALGYMLGLHSLNKTESNLKSWYGWMYNNGCAPDQWKKWRLITKKKLDSIKQGIYGVTGHKLTVDDFPDSFRNNRVFIENVEFSDKKGIQKIYRDLDITPEIVTQYIEEGTVGDSEWALVNILRARQLTEAVKVPDIVNMAEDLIDQGNSVVIFVNFKDTVKALCSQLNCSSIEGGQTIKARQQIIDDFQEDQENVLVVNISAGGTGLSLHDINGKRPRVSLICPSYSAKEFAQTLGRIHRNGAKSDALQKILVAVDTIEENVIQAVNRKLENMKALHG